MYPFAHAYVFTLRKEEESYYFSDRNNTDNLINPISLTVIIR